MPVSDDPTSSGPAPRPCSVGQWVRPEDADWSEWNSLDDEILVMTAEGPRIVLVPEEFRPSYDNGDPVGSDPDTFWTAWARLNDPLND